MPEIWKELEGFSKYKFSNTGKVWSKHFKRLVSVQPIKYGSDRVVLRNNEGKNVTMPLDIMIALAFIPNPENKPTVNHKNHDKTDNRVENLEWATVTEQNRHKKKVPREIQRLVSSRKV